ncbi:MAG: YidB family protein [Xanthobacteraceae bacterium]
MGLLDDMFGSAVPGGNVSKPLMLALLALLASGALFRGGEREPAPSQPGGPRPREDEGGGLLDGLGGLLDRFRQSGGGKAADSWVRNGPNEPVSPGQVGDALGPNILKNLAERSGMSEEELLKQLSQVLPGVVDKLTPHGRLPTAAELGPR